MQKKKSAPNTILVAERESRGWTQEEVAKQIGTTAPNVSRWERGETRPGAYFRQHLSTLFGKSAEDLGLVNGTAPSPQATTEEDVANEASTAQQQPAPPHDAPSPQGETGSQQTGSGRHSRRVFLLGITGLALLGGSGAAWLLLHPRKQIMPGATLCDYRGHTGRVRSVAWSPDGRFVASGSEDTTVQIWSPRTFAGSLVRTYRRHLSEVTSVAWSPDGTRIASASKSANIWDPNTGERMLDYHDDGALVSMVCWSPDGTRIASASRDGTVHVWNALTGETRLVYTGHSNWVTAAAWSPDGTRIASASRDGTVHVWNALTGETRLVYRGHAGRVHAVAWSPDGKSIASGGEDTAVQVWDAERGSHLFTLSEHTRSVLSVAWNSTGSRIASGSQDKTVQVGDTTREATVLTYAGALGVVFAASWEPSGTFCVASGSGDRAVRVWQAL
jgi:WD40 repeat protein/DNA-binding XRE family transcriptional regulator